ncbi:MAG: hypothetical protein NVS4B9_07590 [Ktedonobacteraceae bacterium]
MKDEALTLFQGPVADPGETTGAKERKLFRLLLSCLCLSEVCYLLLLCCSLLPGLQFSSTPLVAVWSRLPFFNDFEHTFLQQAWHASVLLSIVFTGLLGIYIIASLGLFRVAPEAIGREWLYLILGGALLFGGTLLFQPMLFSDDVFTFMFSGRLLSIYHLNPWTTIPATLARDPYLIWVGSGRDTFNIFGPCWLEIAAVLSTLSSDPASSLFLFKGFILGTHLLNCLLVWMILSKIAPERRALGTLLYAWCPLALIELAGSGHSEGILLSALLLATLLYVELQLRIEQRPPGNPDNSSNSGATRQEQAARKNAQGQGCATGLLSSPALLRVGVLLIFGVALSINLIALLIVPLYMWFDLRRERNIGQVCLMFCGHILVVLIPEILLILPFWNGAETFLNFTSAVDMDHFVHAPVGILAEPLHQLYQAFAPRGLTVEINPGLAADVTVRASAALVFVVLYANLFSKVRAAPTTREAMRKSPTADQIRVPGLDVLLSCSGTAVFWYMILISGWFWPWYILWMLWPFVLWRFNTFSSTILVLAGTALFMYAFVGFSRAPLATYQSAIIFGVPLVYLVVVRNRERHAERIVTSHGGRSQTTQN